MLQHIVCIVLLVVGVWCQSHDVTSIPSNDVDQWAVFDHLWDSKGLYLNHLSIGRSATKDIDGNHMLSLFLFLLHTRNDSNLCITVDAGAHVGTFTLFAASMGCHVLSFEMQYSSVAAVHFSLRLSGYADRVQQFNVALWNESGIELHWVDRVQNVGNADLFSASPGTGKAILSQRFDEIYTRSEDIFFTVTFILDCDLPIVTAAPIFPFLRPRCHCPCITSSRCPRAEEASLIIAINSFFRLG